MKYLVRNVVGTDGAMMAMVKELEKVEYVSFPDDGDGSFDGRDVVVHPPVNVKWDGGYVTEDGNLYMEDTDGNGVAFDGGVEE